MFGILIFGKITNFVKIVILVEIGQMGLKPDTLMINKPKPEKIVPDPALIILTENARKNGDIIKNATKMSCFVNDVGSLVSISSQNSHVIGR